MVGWFVNGVGGGARSYQGSVPGADPGDGCPGDGQCGRQHTPGHRARAHPDDCLPGAAPAPTATAAKAEDCARSCRGALGPTLFRGQGSARISLGSGGHRIPGPPETARDPWQIGRWHGWAPRGRSSGRKGPPRQLPTSPEKGSPCVPRPCRATTKPVWPGRTARKQNRGCLGHAAHRGELGRRPVFPGCRMKFLHR